MPAAAAPQPSHEEMLESALAALTEADIPPDEHDYASWPDPGSGRPAELASLSDAELAELLAEAPPPPAPAGWPLSYQTPEQVSGWPWPAGFAVRDGSGGGTGFADGGPLDTLDAGLTLAGFADDAYCQAEGLRDDPLVGVLRAWRRLTSWAQARELAVIAALARRRPADGTPPAVPPELPGAISEFLGPEVAAALTLTAIAAEKQVGLAISLATRPATWAALEAGRIDLPRAAEFASMLAPLTAAHADAVEAAVLPLAPGLTTGQLRAALAKAILKLDPEAARRRREEAEKDARVEHWADPHGTATLTGRNLPPAQVLAASKRLTQIAKHWKKLGALGGMDLLRAHAYLALLNGLDITVPPASLLPLPAPADSGGPATGHPGDGHPGPGARHADGNRGPDSGPGPAEGPYGAARCDGDPIPGDQDLPAGLRRSQPGPDLPPLAGLVNLTIPLTTLMRLGDHPGEAAGHGPVDAEVARLLACALAGHRATRWQITVTAPDGEALATGIHRGPTGPLNPGHTAPAAPAATVQATVQATTAPATVPQPAGPAPGGRSR